MKMIKTIANFTDTTVLSLQYHLNENSIKSKSYMTGHFIS